MPSEYTMNFVIPAGPTGPTGPTGPQEIGAAFLVTYNNNTTTGYEIASNQRIPFTRKEIDNTNLCTLNTGTNTIQFTKEGVYRVDFVVTAYVTDPGTFVKETDVIAVGFKKTNEDTVYAGGSTWYQSQVNAKIVGQGMFVISSTDEEMELVNMSKSTITLNTPDLNTTTSDSFLVNPVVTMVIQYLG